MFRSMVLTVLLIVYASAFAEPPTQKQDGNEGLDEVDKVLAPFSKEVSDCIKKLDQWLPRMVIQSSDLALDKASIVPGHEASSVRIPLKQPHGSITALHQAMKDLDSALQFIRLLQSSKIGSVTVDSYDHLFIAERLAKRFPRRDINACERNQILTAVQPCTVCTITEWNNVKP